MIQNRCRNDSHRSVAAIILFDRADAETCDDPRAWRARFALHRRPLLFLAPVERRQRSAEGLAGAAADEHWARRGGAERDHSRAHGWTRSGKQLMARYPDASGRDIVASGTGADGDGILQSQSVRG